MLPINLEMRADVVIIPPQPGHGAVMARRDVSAASAIRYVVEQLPSDERSRAVVRTARALLFIDEIEGEHAKSWGDQAAFGNAWSSFAGRKPG